MYDPRQNSDNEISKHYTVGNDCQADIIVTKKKKQNSSSVNKKVPTISKNKEKKKLRLERKKASIKLNKKITNFVKTESSKISNKDQESLKLLSFLINNTKKSGKNRIYADVYESFLKLNCNLSIPKAVKEKYFNIKREFEQKVFETDISIVNDNLSDQEIEKTFNEAIDNDSKQNKDEYNIAVTKFEDFGFPSCDEEIDIEKRKIEEMLDEAPISTDLVFREWKKLLCPIEEVESRYSDFDSADFLPIYEQKDNIVDSLFNHLVTIIIGGTGCGKSTQIPKILYFSGFNYTDKLSNHNFLKIGMTQPRRIATVNVCNRIRTELKQHSDFVSYQIKNHYDKAKKDEKIHLMTEGILQSMLLSDFLLLDYSVIIIDEVHERSANSEIILCLLLRTVLFRKQLWDQKKINSPPLRLILMSATLDLNDFIRKNKNNCVPTGEIIRKNIFDKLNINVIDVGFKLYPITNYFEETEVEDYLMLTYQKVNKIHSSLPSGSILVFLPGKRDIKKMSKMLQNLNNSENFELSISSDTEFSSDIVNLTNENSNRIQDYHPTNMNENKLNNYGKNEQNLSTESESIDADGTNESKNCVDHNIFSWQGAGDGNGKLKIVELYSGMNIEDQGLAFKIPGENERFVILATNIAETSLTLPNIRYVVDSGYYKTKIYNSLTNSSAYHQIYISKASSNQRAGRAGRLAPGYCYKLYSVEVYNSMPDFPPAEIQNIPLEYIILYLHNIGIRKIINFDFISSITNSIKLESVEKLKNLKMLRHFNDKIDQFCVTKKGRVCVNFKNEPKYASIFYRVALLFKKNKYVPFLILGCLIVSLFIFSPQFYEDYTIHKQRIFPAELRDDLDIIFFITYEILNTDSDDDKLKLIIHYGLTRNIQDLVIYNIFETILVLFNNLFETPELDILEKSGFVFKDIKYMLRVNNLSGMCNLLRKSITYDRNLIEVIKKTIAIDYSDNICVRLIDLISVKKIKISQLSNKDYGKVKSRYYNAKFGENFHLCPHVSSQFHNKRKLPKVVVFANLVEKDNEKYMINLINVKNSHDIMSIIEEENRSCPTLRMYSQISK